MSADRPVEGAVVRARRRFPAGVAEGQWLGGVVLAAAAAVLLTMLAVTVRLAIVAGPGGLQGGLGQFIPVLACVPVVVLRRWGLPVLGVVTVAAGMVTASGSASLPFGVLLGLALYFPALGLRSIPPMPTWAMIAVIAGWIAGWSAIGAWRMMTRDA